MCAWMPRYVPHVRCSVRRTAGTCLAIPLVLGLLFVLSWGTRQMAVPYHLGETLPLSLDPRHLPYYALRTTLRMVAAMVLSLLFTFTYATFAAKNRRAEALLIPILDVLQSVPILGFLSITVIGFIHARASPGPGVNLVSRARGADLRHHDYGRGGLQRRRRPRRPRGPRLSAARGQRGAGVRCLGTARPMGRAG